MLHHLEAFSFGFRDFLGSIDMLFQSSSFSFIICGNKFPHYAKSFTRFAQNNLETCCSAARNFACRTTHGDRSGSGHTLNGFRPPVAWGPEKGGKPSLRP